MEKRWRKRQVLSVPAQAIVAGNAYDCAVDNLSQSGARLTLPIFLKLPQNFQLDLTCNATVLRDCHLAWQDGLTAGVEFLGSKSNLGIAK